MYAVQERIGRPASTYRRFLTETITTRADDPPTPSGTEVWVDTASGSDSDPGTGAQPLATIGAALDLAQPGVPVRVAAGVYYEALDLPRGGDIGQPIV